MPLSCLATFSLLYIYIYIFYSQLPSSIFLIIKMSRVIILNIQNGQYKHRSYDKFKAYVVQQLRNHLFRILYCEMWIESLAEGRKKKILNRSQHKENNIFFFELYFCSLNDSMFAV